MDEKKNPAKTAYDNAYQRQHYRKFSLKLNKEKDEHLIDFILRHKEINAYLRKLVEEDYKQYY